MPVYISPENEYPRFYGDIQLSSPGFNLGDELPEGWIEVQESELPEVPENHKLVEDFPNLINGEYHQTFRVVEMTEDEIRHLEIQKVRNKVVANEPITEEEAALLIG